MKRLLNLGFLPLAALLVALAVTGYAAVTAQEPTPTAQPMMGDKGMALIPELQGLTHDQRFDRLRGAQFTVVDAQGNSVVYVATTGTVAGLTSTGVNVTPNGGTTAVSFTITADTLVHAMPPRGSVQALAQGDKVVVLSRQDSNDAVAILEHRMGGMYHGGAGMPRM